MKKQVLAALALIMAFAASCNVDMEVVPVPSPASDGRFIITADCGDPDTRTQRDFNGKMYWSPGDEIAVVVMNKSSAKLTQIVKFVSLNEAPAATAKFAAAVEQDWGTFDYESFKEIWENDSYDHIAFYPYKKNLSLGYDNSRYAVRNEFPFSQTGVPGTFAPGAFPSIALSHDSSFTFKHPLGGLKFSVLSDNVVKATLSVTYDNNNIFFASTEQYLSVDMDNNVYVTGYGYGGDTDTNSLDLTPQSGKFIPGEAYYFVCPPSTEVESITLTLERADGSKLARTLNKVYKFKSSTFAYMMEFDNGCEWKTDVPIASPEVIEVTKYGGEITFGVDCAADYEVETDADWLLDMGAEGDALASTRIHTFVVKRNEGAARSAGIRIKNSAATAVVTVNQAAGEPLPDYPSIVRRHAVLNMTSKNCAHLHVVNGRLRSDKTTYGDLFEYISIFSAGSSISGNQPEASQYGTSYYPTVYIDGRREFDAEPEKLEKFAAETDAVYPPLTSIGMSSSFDSDTRTLTADLKIYAYKAGVYRITTFYMQDWYNLGGRAQYNVARFTITPSENYSIPGQDYELSAGENTIQLTKTLPSGYNTASGYYLFTYIQVPYGDYPVLRDGNYAGNYYIDNCRVAAIGTTVEPEVTH
jgi:hypothetical protein